MSNESELKCLCIGIGVGAALAFLLAPKSGAETRKLIQSKASEGTDYIRNQALNAATAAGEALERGNRAVRQQKENVVAAVDAGRAAYVEAASTTPAI